MVSVNLRIPCLVTRSTSPLLFLNASLRLLYNVSPATGGILLFDQNFDTSLYLFLLQLPFSIRNCLDNFPATSADETGFTRRYSSCPFLCSSTFCSFLFFRKSTSQYRFLRKTRAEDQLILVPRPYPFIEDRAAIDLRIFANFG